MRNLLLVLALGLTVVAEDHVLYRPQKIVGGSLTTINQYPSIVALLYSGNLATYWHTCGGTIINSRTIMTAAHCPDNIAETMRWRVRVGSTFANSGGTVHNFQRILNHPGYTPYTGADNDISLMQTASSIVYVNNAVQPASISGRNYVVPNNSPVWAAGWGVTETSYGSEQLRHVQIWKVPHATCVARYLTIPMFVLDSMMCVGWLDVGGRAQCWGDSGSPLYHNGVVVGVCSWGQECGDPFFPSVNTRVSYYADWIIANAF